MRSRLAELGPRGFVRWFVMKKIGKPIVRAIDDFMASQSTVGTPAIFDAALFPWVADLEANWKTIRGELDALLVHRETIPAIQQIQPDQTKVSPDDKWRAFFFCGLGHPSERARAECPETARLLSGIPGLRTAFFSILAPGKHIPRHVGLTKGLVRCHLGLVVPREPERCVMQIADHQFHWEEGRAIVFDDTYKHEVFNDTDEERAVLLIDIVRPMRWPGRLAYRLNEGLLRLSPYMRDAIKNQRAWDRRTAAPGAASLETLLR